MALRGHITHNKIFTSVHYSFYFYNFTFATFFFLLLTFFLHFHKLLFSLPKTFFVFFFFLLSTFLFTSTNLLLTSNFFHFQHFFLLPQTFSLLQTFFFASNFLSFLLPQSPFYLQLFFYFTIFFFTSFCRTYQCHFLSQIYHTLPFSCHPVLPNVRICSRRFDREFKNHHQSTTYKNHSFINTMTKYQKKF